MSAPFKIPTLTNRLRRLVPQIDATLLVEPTYQFTGKITFANGKISYFWLQSLDINPHGAVRVVQDKAYTSFFLKKYGFSVPLEKTFFSQKINARVKQKSSIENAKIFAERIGFPVVVKPNSLSLGQGVFFVEKAADFEKYAQKVLEEDRVGLVQKAYSGKDYRVVVFDGEVFAAYERNPLSIVGDGHNDILFLIKNKQKQLSELGKDAIVSPQDARILSSLKKKDYTFSSILPKGKKIQLLQNANLSDGGMAIDVTGQIHPFFKNIAVEATRQMSLNLCGVDIMCEDITRATEDYVIIELNASPGLDGYALLSEAHDKRVDELYLRVLRFMERN